MILLKRRLSSKKVVWLGYYDQKRDFVLTIKELIKANPSGIEMGYLKILILEKWGFSGKILDEYLELAGDYEGYVIKEGKVFIE